MRRQWVPPPALGERAGARRRQLATADEVTAALHDLDVQPQRVRADQWPVELPPLDLPGLYSWWTDEAGALDLTRGVGHPLSPGRIYAGLTGATKWPSGTTGRATLRSRIGQQHLRGSVRGSTFRRTLAAALLVPLELVRVAPARLEPESERRLSAGIRDHLEVATHAYDDADALADLER